jgi:hypothetical protein
LAGQITERKGTLYICAGLRCIWDLLYDESSRKKVDAAERKLDGTIGDDEFRWACWASECPTFGYDWCPTYIREQFVRNGGRFDPNITLLMDLGLYSRADIESDQERIGDVVARRRLENAAHIAYHRAVDAERGCLDAHMMQHLNGQREWPGAWLVREIFGNPFKETRFASEWRTPTVLALAAATYADRAYDRLPIVADALEEAGCDDIDLLLHCRGDGPHVHGCWVIDLILDKV